MSVRQPDVRMAQSVKEILSGLISRAVADGKSVALWQLPATSIKALLIADTITMVDSAYALEESPPGYLVAPFDPAAAKYFLPAEAMFVIGNNSVEQTKGPEFSLYPASAPLPSFHQARANPLSGQSRNEFEDLVVKSLTEIKRGSFEKVVPSRYQQVTLPENTDLITIFENLCASYPNAFVSLCSGVSFGTWMGASPELLVQVDKNQIFRTTAIASTQPLLPDTDLKRVAWNQKEIEEQALVERYIISCFKKIRLREFDEHGPRTVRAGNLLHLKTDFSVDMQATNFPQLGTVMLQLLHPTSAVCGMPLTPALEFLRTSENYDRKLYSGFSGPVNIDGDTQLYVNLRCMQVSSSTATLYAGAGVTVDSMPSQEWEETVMKMQTLQRVIVS